MESPMHSLRLGTDLHYAGLYHIATHTATPDLYLTTYGSPVVFEGNTYTPVAAVVVSATREEIGLRGSDVEMSGALTDELITEDSMAAGSYSKATITFYVVDARYPWAGYFRKDIKDVREISYSDNTFTCTLTGLGNRTQVAKGWTHSRNCRDYVGGPKCRLDLTPFTYVGVRVLEVIDDVTFKVNTTDLPVVDNGYFDSGRVYWTLGNNTGGDSPVRSYIGASRQIQLMVAPEKPIQVGDNLTITPGCDGTRMMCATKFDHYLHYQGQPFLPGPKRVLDTPRSL